MPSSWQRVVYTPPICITIRLPFVSQYFSRSIRVRGRWDTPNKLWHIISYHVRHSSPGPSGKCRFGRLSAGFHLLDLFSLVKKHIKKNHVNKNFTGLSRDFGGNSVYVFFLPHKEWPEKHTHTNKFLAPTQSRGNPAICLCLCVFFFPWFFLKCRFGCLSAGFGVLSANCGVLSASFAEKEEKKQRKKKIKIPRKTKNSGVQNSFPKIRPQIRVLEVQNPLRRNLSLHVCKSCLTAFFRNAHS